MIAQAAISGLGAALLPRFLMEEELASGALVELPGGVMTRSEPMVITKQALRSALDRVGAVSGSGEALPCEDVEQLWKLLDANGDGVLTLDELGHTGDKASMS